MLEERTVVEVAELREVVAVPLLPLERLVVAVPEERLVELVLLPVLRLVVAVPEELRLVVAVPVLRLVVAVPVLRLVVAVPDELRLEELLLPVRLF